MSAAQDARALAAQDARAVAALRACSLPLESVADWGPILERAGRKRVVLLGEASHGTHEFYALRAELTRRLIVEHGFSFVAVEADWPDAYRVNRWVKHHGRDVTARDALSDFRRFPLWMWRNREVASFATWLRAHDALRPPGEQVGFYGLDLYSLHASIAAVVDYLERVDPTAAEEARQRYACFDHVARDPQEYGLGVWQGTRRRCLEDSVAQLSAVRRQAHARLQTSGLVAEDERFFAEQNARLIVHAEEYYREMFARRVNTWNIRDRHMAATLGALLEHHEGRGGPPPRAIVWEHNSHVGDARATEREEKDELNLGQLCRERYGADTFSLGFTTHSGTVTAASTWGGPMEKKRVRPALEGSVEELLHRTGRGRLLVPLWDPRAQDALAAPRLERAIGVIYRPDTERASHYAHAEVARQFDALVHIDVTRALEPLDRSSLWDEGEPEAWPTGL